MVSLYFSSKMQKLGIGTKSNVTSPSLASTKYLLSLSSRTRAQVSAETS